MKCAHQSFDDKRFSKICGDGTDAAYVNRLSGVAARFRMGRIVMHMLYYAVIFFIIALIAALFGFAGVVAAAAGFAKILFFLFLILAVMTFLMSLTKN